MTGGRAVAVAVAAIALVLVQPASGAGAQAPPDIAVTVEEPVVDGAVATIAGTAEMAGLLDRVTGVTVTVAHAAIVVACPGTCGAPVDQNPRSVAFAFTTPHLAYNGPYTVTAEVAGRRLIDSFNTAEVSGQGTTSFRLEIPPAPPANVQAVPHPDGSVKVTWTRNTEADLVGYQVQRRDLPSSRFLSVGPALPQPPEGATVQWVDTTTSIGGRFEYQVVAIRRDGDGAVSDRATATSAPADATVPVPPLPPIGAPGAPGGPGGSGLGLSSLTNPAGANPGSAAAFSEADGEFSQTLPFGRQRDAGARASRPADDAVVVLGHTTNRRALLLPVATGLLLCVAAFHLRLFNRRVLGSPAATHPPAAS